MKKRTSNIIFLIVLGFFLLVCANWIWAEVKMKNYNITCAKYVGSYKAKSYWHYTLEYKVGSQIHLVSRRGNDFDTNISKYLDTVDCIEIAYSESDNSCIRILDTKLAKDWLWFLDEKDK